MTATIFRLEVPARPEAVRVMRSVASAAAAEANMGYDKLDDLGLAIDEASAVLLECGAGAELVCKATAAPHGLAMSIAACGDPAITGSWPPPPGSLGEVVLRAVASSVELTSSDGNPTVRFTVG